MKMFLVCAAFLWLAAARAAGQEATAEDAPRDSLPAFVRLGPAGPEARRLLQSGENRERAWGAYLAGLHGLKAEAPRLVEMLADPALAGGGWEEALVLQATLDALIRLGAEVPAETLLPLRQSAPDEVIILLARDPRRHLPALLALFAEETPGSHWLAVGNLLAEARARGFAARLMGELKIAAGVHVYDSEGEHGYNGGGEVGSGGGCSGFHVPEDLPPVGYYSVGTFASRGAVVFAPGRRTVYYRRALSRGACGGGFGGGWVDREEGRVEYLAEMLGTTAEEIGLEARPFHEVVCKEARQCGRSLTAVRDGIVSAYAGTVSRLLAAELLDPAEAAELKPDVTLYLKDWRGRRTFPLPTKLKGVKVEVEGAEAEPEADPAAPSPDAPR